MARCIISVRLGIFLALVFGINHSVISHKSVLQFVAEMELRRETDQTFESPFYRPWHMMIDDNVFTVTFDSHLP
jgi:hypothetical protein